MLFILKNEKMSNQTGHIEVLPTTGVMQCLLVGVIDVMLCVVMYQIVHCVTPRFANLLSGKGFANV